MAYIIIMKIRIKYYAAVREEVGINEEVLDIKDGTSMGDLIDIISRKHGLKGLNVSCLVNNLRVTADRLLHAEDFVVIFPPVAGG